MLKEQSESESSAGEREIGGGADPRIGIGCGRKKI